MMSCMFSTEKDNKVMDLSSRMKSLEDKLLGLVVQTNGEEVRKVLPMDKWVFAVPGEGNSPKIMRVWEDTLNIKFPPYSSDKYDHKIISRRKLIEIEKGVLYDKFSDRKWIAGDTFELNPEDNIIPITKNNQCLVKVTLL